MNSFFFSSRRRHTRSKRDWSSDVCSSDLLYALSLVAFIARLRRSFAFDVIDAHFTYPDGVAAVLLGKLFHTPAVVTIRGTHDLRHARSRLRRLQIRWALGAAAGVIAVSDSLRRFAEQLGI